MSARIRIESGISAGTSYWIDRPVLRIGSDPQCEICLPTAELAPHALTLEFRSGAYRAYNRGTSPVTIGGAVVQPGAAVAWGEDETVQLPGDLRLVMNIDGDPRPCPRPETRADDGFAIDDRSTLAADAAGAASAKAGTKSSSKSLVQLAIIGTCVVATGAFLMMPRGGETPAQNLPSFDAIVVASLNKDDNIRALIQQLQYAQSFLVRGHYDFARARFSMLRDRLVHEKDSLPEADRKDAQQILDYVEYRLSQLP